MKRVFYHIPILLFLFIGCKKNEGSIYDCTLSPEFLEGGYKKANVSMNGLDILYDTTKIRRCERDDVLVIFSSASPNSGEFNIVDGGIQCVPTLVREGSWILTGDTLILNQLPMKVNNFTCLGFDVEYRAPNISDPTQMADYRVLYYKVPPVP